MPSIALALCSLLVAGLLVIERRANPQPSTVAWIPLAWMLVASSKPLGVWFGAIEGNEGSVLDQYFGITLLGLALVVLIHRRFEWSKAFGANFWLVLLLGYMAASILWSDIPQSAFKRWGREVIAVLMACIVASEQDPPKTMEAIFRRLAYVLVPVSLLLIKYFPDLGVQYRWAGGQMWIGATLQKNGLGRLCLIAAFFLAWSLIRTWPQRADPAVGKQRKADMLILGVACFLLLGPDDQYSATALVSLGVGCIAYAALRPMRSRGKVLGRVVAVGTVALVMLVGAWQPFAERTSVAGIASELGRDATLTGRTEIWFGLSYVALAKPLLGSGVASFWTEEAEIVHSIGEAHNGYLDIVLCLGFTGLLLTMLFVLSCCAKAQREMTRDFDWGCLWYCFLLMAAVHNVTESSLNTFTTQMTATLLFLSLASLKSGAVETATATSSAEVQPLDPDPRGAS